MKFIEALVLEVVHDGTARFRDVVVSEANGLIV
jgi:hypothetical protein